MISAVVAASSVAGPGPARVVDKRTRYMTIAFVVVVVAVVIWALRGRSAA